MGGGVEKRRCGGRGGMVGGEVWEEKGRCRGEKGVWEDGEKGRCGREGKGCGSMQGRGVGGREMGVGCYKRGLGTRLK